MLRINCSGHVLIFAAVVSVQLAAAKDGASQESLRSPRLSALAKQLTGDGNRDRTTIDKFWQAMRGNGPLVERVVDDPRSRWMTFLWRGDDKTERVNIQGGPATAEAAGWMKRLSNTDLWYRTVRVPDDARFVYFFQVNRPDTQLNGEKNVSAQARPDPLNPRVLATNDASLVELAAAPRQPWLNRAPGVPRGKVSKRSIQSQILKQARSIAVYTPPNSPQQDEPYRLLILFDGEDFQRPEQIPGPTILDNLLSKQKIHPMLVVFVNQIERDRELACSEGFAEFVAVELLPWIQSRYGLGTGPKRTIIGGSSLGGLMASYCAFRHSDKFGNVLSLSGAYHWLPSANETPAQSDLEPAWLTRQFLAARRLPIRFYLSAGRFEHRFPVSLLAENRRFRDVLEAKGYRVKYSEFSGGHDPVCWRSPFVDGLIALAGIDNGE